MKLGTDAVLLGAWAGIGKAENILDIGCGCGIISLMLAQRFPQAKISAIDIHRGSVEQARDNFDTSPWRKNMSARQISLQELLASETSSYDLIVSNPPFFIDSLLPPDQDKKLAKHTGSLSYAELAEGSSGLLRPGGRFALILPYDKREVFSQHALQNKLYLSRQLILTPICGKAANRVLLEWTNEKSDSFTEYLTIRKKNREYTDDYRDLTADFYLAL